MRSRRRGPTIPPMGGGEATRTTQIVEALRDGDPEAAERLWQIVYPELRRLAGSYMRSQDSGHTLQPTAVVNEAYLRLVGTDQPWSGRAHFMAVAAKAMRHTLVDHARRKKAAKRGRGAVMITLLEDLAIPRSEGSDAIDLLALEEALSKLQALNARHAAVVELRFYGGLTQEDIAEILGVSRATVRSDLTMARAWLSHELCA